MAVFNFVKAERTVSFCSLNAGLCNTGAALAPCTGQYSALNDHQKWQCRQGFQVVQLPWDQRSISVALAGLWHCMSALL